MLIFLHRANLVCAGLWLAWVAHQPTNPFNWAGLALCSLASYMASYMTRKP